MRLLEMGKNSMECPGRYYRGWYWCSAATTRAHVTVLLLRLRAAAIPSPEVVRGGRGSGESSAQSAGGLVLEPGPQPIISGAD